MHTYLLGLLHVCCMTCNHACRFDVQQRSTWDVDVWKLIQPLMREPYKPQTPSCPIQRQDFGSFVDINLHRRCTYMEHWFSRLPERRLVTWSCNTFSSSPQRLTSLSRGFLLVWYYRTGCWWRNRKCIYISRDELQRIKFNPNQAVTFLASSFSIGKLVSMDNSRRRRELHVTETQFQRHLISTPSSPLGLCSLCFYLASI